MKTERVTLSPSPGLTTTIGYYASALDEVREQLREAVTGLSNEQLGRRAVTGTHSIGALVLHIGEAEWWWMECVINGHVITDEDQHAPYWDVLERPEEFAGKNYSAQFCLDTIEKIRRRTRELLASFTDADLDRIFTHTRPHKTMEVSLRWVLHHLSDHESQHRGQILMLKRLLNKSAGIS